MTKLLINEPPIPTFPSLAYHVGINEALILQQVHYWLSPRVNGNFFAGCHWVYNTYEQWQTQFPFLSVRTVQRTFQSLEKREFLISFSKCHHLQKTKYYTINYERLSLMKDLLPAKWRHENTGHENPGFCASSPVSSSNHSMSSPASSPAFLEETPADLEPHVRTGSVETHCVKTPSAEAHCAETVSVKTVSVNTPCAETVSVETPSDTYLFQQRDEPPNLTEWTEEDTSLEDRLIEDVQMEDTPMGDTPFWSVGSQDSDEEELQWEPLWEPHWESQWELQEEIQEESDEEHLFPSDVRPTGQFGVLVKSAGEQNFQAGSADFSPDSIFLPLQTPACEEFRPKSHFDVNQDAILASSLEGASDYFTPKSHFGVNQQANLARSYNTYTETTNREEREEKREREKEKNKKEKGSEIFWEKKLDPKWDPKSDQKLGQKLDKKSGSSGSDPYPPMVDLWNRLVQEPLYGPGRGIQLTNERARQLERLGEEVLHVRGSSWEGFCQAVSQNGFLMGKGRGALKVTFDWAILPQNAQKILEGAFQDRRPAELRGNSWEGGSLESTASAQNHPPSPEKCIQILRHHCETHRFPEAWYEASTHFINALGFFVWRNWIQKLTPLNLQGEVLQIGAPNTFFRDHILQNYDLALTQALRSVCPSMKYVTFKIIGERHDPFL